MFYEIKHARSYYCIIDILLLYCRYTNQLNATTWCRQAIVQEALSVPLPMLNVSNVSLNKFHATIHLMVILVLIYVDETYE